MPDVLPIRCLIVDDEPPARAVIRNYLKEVPGLYCMGECGNTLDALQRLQQEPCDLLFLDIQMPRLSGIELLKLLRHPPRTILTTAYGEHALEGFDLDVVDYLLKPIRFERFLKAIQKAHPLIPGNNMASTQAAPAESFVYFRANRKMVKVWLRDLYYVESLKDYVRIVTREGTLICKQSLSSVEAMLPARDFLRIHRSFLVSLAHVQAYGADSLIVQQQSLPIGKLYRANAMKILNPASRPGS